MGVYIKNMEMPTNCWFCSVKSWDDDEYVCPFSGRTVKSGDADANRHEDCPLIEIPDHGDLIDRDALFDDNSWDWFNEWGSTVNKQARLVLDAPVVIPEDRSEDND